LKTHAKTALVVRKESGGLRAYAHIGTGNYHVRTARLYSDLGLFTCDPKLTQDVISLFHHLTGHSHGSDAKTLLIAPSSMRTRFLELIRREIENILKLQDRRHKEEIGFESQKQKAVEEARQLELHQARVRLANARASHLEIDSDIRETCEAALPGHMRIPFEDLSDAFKVAVKHVSDNLRGKQAA
jgi:polyphosphate kinase